MATKPAKAPATTIAKISETHHKLTLNVKWSDGGKQRFTCTENGFSGGSEAPEGTQLDEAGRAQRKTQSGAIFRHAIAYMERKDTGRTYSESLEVLRATAARCADMAAFVAAIAAI